MPNLAKYAHNTPVMCHFSIKKKLKTKLKKKTLFFIFFKKKKMLGKGVARCPTPSLTFLFIYFN
jgi:hypothetical protein